MSTLKANKVRNVSATVDNLELDSSGNVSVYGVGDVATALAAKAPTASPTFTGNVVWSGATLRAAGAKVDTGQTTTSTTYADLATVGPQVTITTGTKALVIWTTWASNSSAGPAVYASLAISGATTLAASDDWGAAMASSLGGYSQTLTRAYIFTGLTAGSNTFTVKYRQSSGTSTFAGRTIVAYDLGS